MWILGNDEPKAEDGEKRANAQVELRMTFLLPEFELVG